MARDRAIQEEQTGQLKGAADIRKNWITSLDDKSWVIGSRRYCEPTNGVRWQKIESQPVEAIVMANALDLARCICLEAGDIIKAAADRVFEIAEKAPGDLVTEVDRASEAHIVRRLRDAYPSSSILIEESGLSAGTASDRWIVDPLDGTTNFAHGYPVYCISMAYEVEGEVVCAAIYAPATSELFLAEKGSGAHLNGRPLRVSKTEVLASALLAAGFAPSRFELNRRNFEAIYPKTRGIRHDGSAALDLAYVAAGRFDAFWEYQLRPWDVAAGALCVREAGGRVSRPDGSQLQLDEGSTLATNGFLHAELVGLLRFASSESGDIADGSPPEPER